MFGECPASIAAHRGAAGAGACCRDAGHNGNWGISDQAHVSLFANVLRMQVPDFGPASIAS